MRRFMDEGQELDIPPCPLPWLADLLMEIGPASATMGGQAQISWADISAWSDCSGVRLPLWSARLLRQMSGSWLSQFRASEKPDCPAPWQRADAAVEASDQLDKKLRRAMEILSGAKK